MTKTKEYKQFKTNKMKKLLTISGAVLLVSIILASCGGGDALKAKNDKEAAEKKALEEKQVKLEKQKLDSINTALSAIQVHIYNHTPLYFDSEGWCINELKGESVRVFDVKDFNKTKTYNCNTGNYIQKLSINGNFKGINIQFLDAKDKLVKEFKNYNLETSVIYSDINYQSLGDGSTKDIKDKFFQDWFNKSSKIQLLYEDSVFYSANWKNSGWSIQ